MHLLTRLWQFPGELFRHAAGSARPRLERAFHRAWPLIWWGIASVYRMLPRRGRLNRAFTGLVFTGPWNKWYRSAYIPENRDRFFEYILTFFYEYPIKKGDTVVQVGASFGEETARFARSVGAKGRVIAVEPEASNLEKLRRSFAEYPQVSIVPKGAWNETGSIELLVGGEREHRLADIPAEKLTYEWWGVLDHLEESRYRGSTSVSVDRLDNMAEVAAVEAIDFVLVETNGTELEAVQGMEGVLARTKRLGVRGHVMRDGIPINLAIAEFLRARGFEASITSEGMVLARNEKDQTRRSASTSSKAA